MNHPYIYFSQTFQAHIDDLLGAWHGSYREISTNFSWFNFDCDVVQIWSNKCN